MNRIVTTEGNLLIHWLNMIKEYKFAKDDVDRYPFDTGQNPTLTSDVCLQQKRVKLHSFQGQVTRVVMVVYWVPFRSAVMCTDSKTHIGAKGPDTPS